MTELTKGLRGQLLNCRCQAHSRGECGCGTTWPEDCCAEAADEIERLQKVVLDFEQTPGWRDMQATIKKLTEENAEQKQLFDEYRQFMSGAAIDAKRWRYWRSLFDRDNKVVGYSAKMIDSPDELDAAVDAAMKENK